jgi:hypothetical protein
MVANLNMVYAKKKLFSFFEASKVSKSGSKAIF